jgi:hypothetical protein
MNYRKLFRNDLEKLEESLIQNNQELESEIKTKNFNEIKQAYTVQYSFSEYAEMINEKLIIDPFMGSILQNNPLKQTERRYPVDLTYLKSRMYSSEITIPEGYEIEELPKNKQFNTDKFILQYTVNHTGNKVKIQAMYKFNSFIFSPEEYLKIKRYFSLIIKYVNQKIILKKVQ